MGLLLSKEPVNVTYHPVELENTQSLPLAKKRGKGRPRKEEMEAVRNRTKGKVGRPKGDAGRMKEFKERLLATAGDRIVDTVIRIGLDDEHPGQMAALKMCMDRMLPLSMFEKDAKGNRNAVTINIVGVNETKIISHDEDPLEEEMYGEIIEVEDSEE